MVEAVRYKPEGRGFDSLRCHWNFSTQPEIGGKCGRCLGLVTLPPTYADSLEVWEPQPSRTLRARQAWTGTDFTGRQELNFKCFYKG
jgi:hypothetical protein